jgi:site-specific DNA-methyltransferase (adenine-specific)
MAKFPDKFFDLAVVDPPYGINHSTIAGKQSGTHYGNAASAKKHYTTKDWDKSPPSEDYFKELFRISKNQIIWGSNHFISMIPLNSSAWIVWDKENGDNDFADCELAWTSFKTSTRKFSFRWAGMLQGNMKDKEQRIHPTQKPISLYDWIYKNYLPQGGKVIDTHLGSGSNRIAADKAGNIDFYSCELDEEYFNNQELRWKQYKSQLKLF